MFACGLQGTPKDDLSFFHPVPRRRRRPEKVDNFDATNYTLKSLLSLIVTMRYAAARSCRKPSFLGLPNGCLNRLCEGPPKTCRRTPRLPGGAANVLLE